MNPAAGPFIAIDWGTTNRRAWRVDRDGRADARAPDGAGVLALTRADYPRELAAIRTALGPLPVVAAGMVGSSRGWAEVPYVSAPAGLAELAAGSVAIPDADVAILPGVALRHDDRAEIMRGEEVQALGAVAAGLMPADALCCQPGTHNKWITLHGGRIADFTTAMTGELFALLRANGILAGMLDGPVSDGPAFRDGFARGAAGDLTRALFEVRARVLLDRLSPPDAAAFASGILIGADVAGRSDIAGGTVHLIAAGPLADLYAVAIERAGGHIHPIDAEAAFLAGVSAARKHLA